MAKVCRILLEVLQKIKNDFWAILAELGGLNPPGPPAFVGMHFGQVKGLNPDGER